MLSSLSSTIITVFGILPPLRSRRPAAARRARLRRLVAYGREKASADSLGKRKQGPAHWVVPELDLGTGRLRCVGTGSSLGRRWPIEANRRPPRPRPGGGAARSAINVNAPGSR